ncbi:MAG: hypothetical protein J3R72DRAFT_443666 [Linnemannia gamsii]|nr:MAG: hypothetical protein J3R72DRAFT_443666 [Linnemannia gamsii]
MAKKKTTTRKSTRHSTYPHRSSSTTASNSKAASVSLSNASSPSPPPDNHHHHSSSSASYPSSPSPTTTSSACANSNSNNNNTSSSSRRKGLPRRSPSQNDPSKGIVFSFRFQNDPGLSMAVDIRSYDQQFGPPDPDSTSTIAAQKKADSQAGPSSSLSLVGSHAGNSSADDTIINNNKAEGVVRMNGNHWSSDPTAYRNNNVFDHTRNLLILHTRKPATTAPAVESGASSPSTATAAGEATPAAASSATTTANNGATATAAAPSLNSNNHSASFHPYRTQRRSSSSSSSQSTSSSPTSSMASFPSTPALSQAGSSSSSSLSSSSASSSPSSPTSPHSLSSAGVGSIRQQQQLTKCGGDSGMPMPLTLEALSATQSTTTRFLSVRGLGGASRGRRMQVILVS